MSEETKENHGEPVEGCAGTGIHTGVVFVRRYLSWVVKKSVVN